MEKRGKPAPKVKVPPGPVTLEWSFEQAQAAQELAGTGIADPSGAVSQWSGLHEIAKLRDRFTNGDNRALMLAIRICANHDLVMPNWVARAYIAKFDTVNRYRAKSWDDVFGLPLPKGKSLKAARDSITMPLRVYFAVKELVDRSELSGTRRAIDNSLFEEVGASLAISGGQAKRFYYNAKPMFSARAKSNRRMVGGV